MISWSRLARSGAILRSLDLRDGPFFLSSAHEREMGQGHRNQGKERAYS